MIVDVHAHLDCKKFSNDLDEVVVKAKKVGVCNVVNNGLNMDNNKEVLRLSENNSFFLSAFGLYPVDASKSSEEEVEKTFEWIIKHKHDMVAIGEVGLDYHWTKERQRQKAAFEKMIFIAEKTGKPIICHSRKAEADVIDMLLSSTVKKAVLHSFSGKMSLAKKALEAGMLFSIPVNIIKSESMQALVATASIKQLLTETDSPYLGPVRGERNEPSNIPLAIKKIAKIKSLTKEDVELEIYNNFRRAFNYSTPNCCR